MAAAIAALPAPWRSSSRIRSTTSGVSLPATPPPASAFAHHHTLTGITPNACATCTWVAALGFPSRRGEILLRERGSPVEDTRRKFDADFKEGAVRLVREIGKPIARVARELGIKEGTLGNWVNADRRRRDGGDGELSEDERAELVRLRRKCAELELRCDVLKRSVALWVDEAMGR